MSKLWHHVTDRVIDQVEVELPASVSLECLSNPVERPHKISKDIDIKIWEGAKLASFQYGLCGQKGRGIFLPLSLLHSSDWDSQELLLQWINHRFGVFLSSIDGMKAGKSSLQSLLCQGQSARQVVQELTSHQIPRAYQEPSFTYLKKPSRKSIVVVVQRSFPEFLQKDQMSWEVVQSALLPFISSLSNGDQLSIISFDEKNADLNLPLTTLTDDNRVFLHAALPRQPVWHMEACHQCAIDLIQNLNYNQNQVVWLARSGQIPPGYELPANSVVLGLDRSLHESWSNFPVYVMPQCETQLKCQRALVNHLLRVLSHQNWLLGQEKEEGQTTGILDISSQVEGITAVVSAADERDIAWLRLRSPSGKPHTFPIYSHNMALLNLKADQMEQGQWFYDVKMYDAQHPFTLDIFTFSQESNRIEAWVDKSKFPRIALYAATTEENVKKVQATVSRPSHRDQDLPLIQFDLKDSGTGYPDIRAQDGVYSAYFIDLSPEAGFYHLAIEATFDNGSKISTLAPSFHVPQMSSSFYLRQEDNSRLLVSDVFPPNRITDLKVAEEADLDLMVTLSWTAPGSDFDLEGSTAFRYEIRCATSEEALMENAYTDQSISIHSSLVPQPLVAGSPQRCTVGVPWHDQRFYYAVLAIDAAGNRGLISNPVSVFASKPEETQTELPQIKNPLPHSGPNQDLNTALIWGPILALICLFLAALGFFYWRKSCQAREYVCDDEDEVKSQTCSTDLSSVTSSGVSTEEKIWTIEPRVHIMEDFSVYRDLSVISSELPSDYLKIDLMLSALLAAQQQKQRQESLV